MSVNGIEIKVGQKWINKDGEEVEIEDMDSTCEEGLPFYGSNGFWYDEAGIALVYAHGTTLEKLVTDSLEKSTFQEGDVVYTTTKGKGVVVQVATTRSDRVKVKHEDGKEFWHNPLNVSFSPWQAPNHERPPEDGYWIVRINDGVSFDIIQSVGGRWATQLGGMYLRKEDGEVKAIKYLGKEIV